MKRLFWLGLGLAAGALVVRAVGKRARAFTPRGIATGVGTSAGQLLESVRGFVDDVKAGMAEREAQIHSAFAEGVTFDEAEFDLDRDNNYLREGKRH